MQLLRKAGSAVLIATAALLLIAVSQGRAVHESTTALVFAPIAGSSASASSGEGTIDYHGGLDTLSRWTGTFRYTGLQPAAEYTVVVQGRFGEDGSPEAQVFAPICSFTTDPAGAGGCWYYFLELRRLGVAQLRAGDANGAPILQATREPGGPGSMTSVPNRFSPPTPTPTVTTSLSPVASPAIQTTPTMG